MFISAKEVKDKLSITSQTLYNWRKSNKIKYKMISSRKFLYDISSLEVKNDKEIINTKMNVIYVRVSNTKQKDDLVKQESILREYMCSNGVIVDNIFKDIASGMNENRKGLNDLLTEVINGNIDTVYISFKDRLTRFGYGYLENLFDYFGTKIVCINSSKEEDFQQELSEDLISIIHHFSMKMYSNRRKILKITEEKLKSSEN